MQECSLLLLLALALVCRTMAARSEGKHGHLLTKRKCCKAAGNMFYLAADQLGSAAAKPGDVSTRKKPEPASQAKFSDQICVQGSAESNSWTNDCKKKTYVFVGSTIKLTSVKTLGQADCPTSTSRCHDEITWHSVRKASEHQRAEKLQCNTNSIQRKSNATDCDKRPTVAIFADYDGCWDIISRTNIRKGESWFNQATPKHNYKTCTSPLRKKIKDITAGKRVILFVGSNRQSWEDDDHNNEQNNNGLALGTDNAFERWVQEFGGLENNCWELNTALLSDNKQPCSSWNKRRESPWASWSSEKTKTKLLENGIKQLLLEDHVDLYFFDDHADYLQHVRKYARIPPNMQLYTIHYAWLQYAKGATTGELQAIAA
mmetsp:Transcript_117819/g.229100  ORF Transcript_117819/g.229100 Transcript_117819/m.229100 type:complete len:374 (+) Transcript_117819:51-1172(+)